MGQGSDTAADKDAQHKANSAIIAAQVSVNTAKAATVPSNVGRTEPAMDLNAMQGTANKVVPNRVASAR